MYTRTKPHTLTCMHTYTHSLTHTLAHIPAYFYINPYALCANIHIGTYVLMHLRDMHTYKCAIRIHINIQI